MEHALSESALRGDALISQSQVLSTSENQNSTIKQEGTRGCILIIDDEQMILDLMKSLFEPHGLKIQGFVNPFDAVQWYNAHWNDVDLVFLDMKNPYMDGEHSFALLQGINSDVRVALMSGNASGEVIRDLLGEGALRFFAKPFYVPNLIGWVLHRGMCQ